MSLSLSLAIPLIIFLFTFTYILRAALSRQKQPPGPPGLPILGNLHMLGSLPHRSLQSLAKKYGPIMSLHLGTVPTIVVSSPEAAELFLKTHDIVFANRPKFQAAQYTGFGGRNVAFAQYGAYWRNIRKLCTIHLLSASKVESFAPMRKEELLSMVKSLKKAAETREVVDLSKKVGELIGDMSCKMILGQSEDDRFNLKGLLQETMSLSGAFNLADYVPWLGPFDLQGLTRRLKKTSKALDELLEKMIEEHEQAPRAPGQHKDFIDILLSLMDQPIHPHDDPTCTMDRTSIKANLLDMIIGTSETASAAIEWAISELLHHPRVMKNLQKELENVVGMNKMVEEAHLTKLSYLDMIVKETLRLHPVVPLLTPHESMEDILVEGYYIKKKTRIIINAWAIGRDFKAWSENAEVFYPERFINSNIDLKGQDFGLIPFGSGRRKCPGMLLGLTTVKFVVAQLMHCYDWELPGGMLPHELDMNEKFGLSTPRAQHLRAIPTRSLLPHERLLMN